MIRENEEYVYGLVNHLYHVVLICQSLKGLIEILNTFQIHSVHVYPHNSMLSNCFDLGQTQVRLTTKGCAPV